MTTIQEIVDSVYDLIAGRVSVEDFEDWSADLSWDAHRRESDEVRELAYEIRGVLNRHENDADDQILKQELVTTVLPFAQPAAISLRRIDPAQDVQAEVEDYSEVGSSFRISNADRKPPVFDGPSFWSKAATAA